MIIVASTKIDSKSYSWYAVPCVGVLCRVWDWDSCPTRHWESGESAVGVSGSGCVQSHCMYM